MRAEPIGSDTLLGQIVNMVAEAQRSRVPIQGLADRISSLRFSTRLWASRWQPGALYPLFGWLLSLVIAGAAMSLSSVSVISNALRLRKVKL